MINSNNANINQMPTVIYEQKILHSGSRTKQILNSKTMYWKCLLIFVLLSILGYGVLLLFFVKNIIQIDYLRTSNNQHIEIIQQLENQMKQLKKNGNCYSHPVSKIKSDFNVYYLVMLNQNHLYRLCTQLTSSMVSKDNFRSQK
jgi:hypothetical protein